MQSPSPRITVPTVSRPDFEISVPGSKSISNRALLIASLAGGISRLEGLLEAEDTVVMRRALSQLGFEMEEGAGEVRVSGRGGVVPVATAELDLRLSGTSIRFLAALVSLGRGKYRLDGNARMRERPIGDLLHALESLGVHARSLAANDCPPVLIESDGLAGGKAQVSGGRSSQYLSGLLMVAPYARSPVTLEVGEELHSKPFVDMTVELMARFGVTVERDGYRRFEVPSASYQARHYRVEGDAMAAGYFWAAAAITGGRVKVVNVGRDSLQGDRRLAEVLARMGCEVTWGDSWCEVVGPPEGSLRGGSFDLNDMSDQAQTLAAVALFAKEPVEIDNVWNLRIKETDRLAALATELRKFGARVEEREDGLLIEPPARVEAATVETYGDHRMAMALALPGLRVPGTVILDPDCVAKTYPGFFEDLAALARGAAA